MTAATGLVVCAIGGAAQATVSGWRWESPALLGRVMRGVAVAGSLSYAIGDDGVLLRSDDGGAHWTVLDAGMSEPVQRLQIIDESTLVIGEGELGCHTLISTDAGETFTPIFNSAKAKCVPVAAFSFLSPRIGFLLLSDGAVEMTGDGGGTFSARAAIPGSTAVTGIVHEGDYTTHEVLGVEIHFRSPTSGIAFLTPSFRSPGYKGSVNLSTGPSVAYTTSDGGSSWSPVALPADAQVKTVDFVNDRVAYAAGPGTLLYSADGGATWEALPVLQYETPEGVACFTAASCVLQSGVTTKLMALHGNATPMELAHPSLPICMAGNQLPSQIVSLGGPAPDNASLLSGEAGLSCPPESSRPEVEYLGLMQGPGKLVYAPGSDGRLALSADEGQSWKVIATPSSWPLAGLVFADPRFGLALGGKDGRRILWQTKDGGASWQRLAAGTSHARAVTLVGKRIALAIDFHSISRSILGGPFKPVARHIKGFADIAEFDRAGSAVCAYGAHVLLQSTDAGAHWQRLRLPRSGRQSVSIVSVSFVSRSRGYLLDRSGRLWLTRDGGMRWRQILSTGQTASTYREEVYFANARVGFLAGFDYPGDEDRA
ncbi:MAG: WD40/YVTN/BNR-like repeat-containing protein, partial [Solirubrobacteraceae bacterium]